MCIISLLDANQTGPVKLQHNCHISCVQIMQWDETSVILEICIYKLACVFLQNQRPLLPSFIVSYAVCDLLLEWMTETYLQ